MLEKDTIPRDIIDAATWPVRASFKFMLFPFTLAYRVTKAANTTRDRKVTGRLYWIDEQDNDERHRAWSTRSE